MRHRAEAVVEDGAILVLAGDGVAMAAPFAQAAELGQAEISTARALQEIAADRGDRADLGAGRVACRLCKRWIARADHGIRLQTRERDHRSHPQALFRRGRDRIEAGRGGKTDRLRWREQALHHEIDNVDAAGHDDLRVTGAGAPVRRQHRLCNKSGRACGLRNRLSPALGVTVSRPLRAAIQQEAP